MANTITIQLDHVDESITPPLKALTMLRPKVRDELAAREFDKDPAKAECVLIASLCEVGLDTIENLDMADYLKLQKTYQEMQAGNA